MTDPLTRKLPRRTLLTSAAAAGAGLALARVSGLQARRGRAVEVLTHDEVQEAPAFARGKHYGTTLQAANLGGAGVFESETIQSPFPFTHVGLHWKGNAPKGAFEVRTSADGNSWTTWHSLHIEAGPDDTPAGETYASL